MARPVKDTNEIIAEGLQNVIDRVQAGSTSWGEVEQCAYEFCRKNYAFYTAVAGRINVVPSRLLLFSMLMVEHPLLIDGAGHLNYGFLKATAELMVAELSEMDMAAPPKMNYFHIPESGWNGNELERMVLSTANKADIQVEGVEL